MKFSLKLPGLPFGKKKKRSDDDDDDDDYDDEDDDDGGDGDDEEEERAPPAAAAAKPAAEDGDGDDDDDDGDDEYEDDDDDDDEDGEGGRKRGGKSWKDLGKRTYIYIGGAATGFLLLCGVGIYFLAGGEDPQEIPAVTLDMPPRGGPFGGAMLTPPAEGGAAPVAGSLNAMAAADTGPGTGVVAATVTKAAFSGTPEVAPGKALSEVPDAALVEQGSQGPLPRVGADGRAPWQVYARPVAKGEDRPRIAVIVIGLGLSKAATQAAIDRLPGAVTLAFDPYAPGLDDWVPLARKAGHETLLALPMETADFPANDPGPYALQTALQPAENLARLEYMLSRLSGYVGVINVMGSKFTTVEKDLRPILTALQGRGLMLVESSTTGKSLAPKIATEIGLPRAMSSLVLDLSPSRAAIDANLAALEKIAQEQFVAIAIASPYPSTLASLAAWSATLDGKNLVLTPVSAVADKQFLR